MSVSADVVGSVIEAVRDCYDAKKPLEDALHEELARLYRQYIVVGGVPEAVQRFVDGRRDWGAAPSVCLLLFETIVEDEEE